MSLARNLSLIYHIKAGIAFAVEVEGRAQHAVGAELTKQVIEHAGDHRSECLLDKGRKWVHAVDRN